MTQPGELPIVVRYGRASFNTVEIPLAGWSRKGAQRIGTHEYPKVAGAQLEKLGRRPHAWSFVVHIDETWNALFPGWYPSNWNRLLTDIDAGTTADLVVPGEGTFRAVCATNSYEITTSVLSGGTATLEFHEDALDPQYALQSTQASIVTLSSAMAALTGVAAAQGVNAPTTFRVPDQTVPVPGGSIIDMLSAIVQRIQAVKDQVQLYDQTIALGLLRTIELCQQLDRCAQLDDCRNATTLDAVMAVWAAAQALQNDLFARQTPLRKKAFDRVMTVDQVSIALYQDTDHTNDLLSLNQVDDPFAIPAGTSLTYYAEAA